MATIGLQPGLNPVQTGVNLSSLPLPPRLRFLLFGKHLGQIAAVPFHSLRWVAHAFALVFGEAWGVRVGSPLELRVVKDPALLPAWADSYW
jgi:membrane associated rhomboid family serine protease